MVDFVTALTGQVSAANLWAQITPAAVFIGAMVLFAFGYKILRRVIKGAGNGKAKA